MANDWRRGNGQYDYSDMDRMCTRGHALGEHSASGTRRCFVGQNTQLDGPMCECEKFKPTRKRRQKSTGG
jgi:hypothetical protein